MVLYPNIEAERARKGLTKDEFAKFIGISRKTYYNWQSGKAHITTEQLCNLAKMLDCQIDYLLGHSNQRTVNEIQGGEDDD